jgi:ABC-type branched-subunit amino acid transport system ATPase component
MNLSHGQRKLLELARALACKPRILMLDEPIAGLFPEMVSQVEQLLLDLRQDGTAIVVVEHRMDFVMRISDVVIVLHNGAKLAEGTPKDISRNDQVLQVYLGGSGSVDS